MDSRLACGCCWFVHGLPGDILKVEKHRPHQVRYVPATSPHAVPPQQVPYDSAFVQSRHKGRGVHGHQDLDTRTGHLTRLHDNLRGSSTPCLAIHALRQ